MVSRNAAGPENVKMKETCNLWDTWEAGNILIIPNNEENCINCRYDLRRQICFPTNGARNILNPKGVSDKPGGQSWSIKRAGSSRFLISSPVHPPPPLPPAELGKIFLPCTGNSPLGISVAPLNRRVSLFFFTWVQV